MSNSLQKYYVLKVKGKAKIPDYLQIRDDKFTLIGYVRPDHSLRQTGLNDPNREIFLQIEARTREIPYGVLTEVEIER